MATREYTVAKTAINAAVLDQQIRAVLGGFYYGLQFDSQKGLLYVLVDTAATAQQLQQARDVVLAHQPSALTEDQQRIEALKNNAFWRISAAEWKSALATMAAAQRDEAIADAVLVIREAVKLLWREINDNGA